MAQLIIDGNALQKFSLSIRDFISFWPCAMRLVEITTPPARGLQLVASVMLGYCGNRRKSGKLHW